MTDIALEGKLDIGRVIQQMFAVLGRNFLTFLVLSLILVGVPMVILGLVRPTPTVGAGVQPFGNLGWTVLSGIAAGLGSLILKGTIIHGTVADLNGRPTSIADSLAAGLRAFLPILGLGIVYGLAMGLGFILLIVPGIMIGIAWCVVVPVYMVEHPQNSFGRTATLTRGNRWRIFGLSLIYIGALFAVQLVGTMIGGISSLGGIIGQGSGNPEAMNQGVGALMKFMQVFVTPIVSVLQSLLGATGLAALYVELRRVKDGVGVEGLAAIFD